MNITGANFTGFTTSSKGDKSFQAFAPAANDFLPGNFTLALSEELEYGLSLAGKAFPVYSQLSYARRADFLDAIAQEIMTWVMC